MKTIEAFGKIDKGELVIYNEEVFWQAVHEIGFVSHCKITLEYGNKRTLDQNAYLWGGIVEPIRLRLLQDGWNFSPGECYRYIERKFCELEQYNEKTGEIVKMIKPLKELSTDQWDEIVMGDVRDWCERDLGIYINMPHEYYGMTIDAYDKWKRGEITKKQAIEISNET